MSPWDLLYASNRLIDSSWNLPRDSCILKALSADQSQPTNSRYANHYAARWLYGHCKYMSRKTIAFWAIVNSLFEELGSNNKEIIHSQ